MKIILEVVGGPFCGNSFHVDRRRVVIGREEGDIRIPDPMISRRHASLEVLDGNTVLVRDLSSTNGTYHNEALIAFCSVKDGDEIRLGKTLMTVSIE